MILISVVSMILVIPVAIKIFYPIYHDMQLTSCYEYLGVRFGKEMRLMGGILYIIQMCFYTSVSVLAPAIALSKATGLNTRLAIVLIYVVCVFYSSQGGLKAVVIADSFQVRSSATQQIKFIASYSRLGLRSLHIIDSDRLSRNLLSERRNFRDIQNRRAE